MKKILFAATMLLCHFAYAQHPDAFKSLTALTGGTWQMKSAKGIIAERWKKADAGKLQGFSFKFSGIDTTILERVDLVEKQDGIYYMVTAIKDQTPTNFKLASVQNNEFIFTNPAHDFPQRVIYQFIKPDSIHARVDGKYKGQYAKQDFYYKRVNN